MVSGIGIGAFVDGMVRGHQLNQQNADREEARKQRELDRRDREEDRAWQREERGFAREEREFQREERNLARSDRAEIRGIQADARTEFDKQVASGDADGDDFLTFYQSYALPRLENALLKQGDYAGANALRAWGKSEDATKGAKLFGQSLFKLSVGDHAGALDDVIKAGKLRGYIAGDFDIADKEEIVDEAGQLLGYRVTVTEGDNETVQDIALDDLPQLIATFGNPESAWESQRAALAQKSADSRELDMYDKKKEIDAKYGASKSRASAIEAVRKANLDFDELSPQEQETLIEKEIALTAGPAVTPANSASVIVDTSSGRRVPPPSPDAVAPVGLGGVPGSSNSGGVRAPGLGNTPQSPAQANRGPQPVINGVTDNQLAPLPTEGDLVKQAQDRMLQGEDPQNIARMLKGAAVAPERWPPELTRVLSQ